MCSTRHKFVIFCALDPRIPGLCHPADTAHCLLCWCRKTANVTDWAGIFISRSFCKFFVSPGGISLVTAATLPAAAFMCPSVIVLVRPGLAANNHLHLSHQTCQLKYLVVWCGGRHQMDVYERLAYRDAFCTFLKLWKFERFFALQGHFFHFWASLTS